MRRVLVLAALLALGGCSSVAASSDDRGWNDSRRHGIAEQLQQEYDDLTDGQAQCIAFEMAELYTFDEVTDTTNYPTRAELAQSTAAIERCL